MGVSETLGILARVRMDVPVDPDGPEAKQLIINELAKPEYQRAKPSWFDQIARAFFDWLGSLTIGGVKGPPAFGLLIILVVVVGAIVIAFLVFGVPRLNRRSTIAAELFGEDDRRTSAQIRAAAQSAANRGDFVTAIAEMFRTIARGLAERTIVTTSPGTTARDFAVRAGVAFPDLADELRTAAVAFDRVRYLGRRGSSEEYEQVSTLESNLRNSRPLLTDAVPA